MFWGGESVLANDVLSFKEKFAHTKTILVNLYGQSESSFNSAQFISTDTPFTKVTLGKIVDDTEILIINEYGEEALPLEVGELVIASNHVALGYWRDPEKTKEVFLQHPELGKLYRTGDLGRLDGGEVEYLGRKDFQIKIRGYRVELGEIEGTLATNSGVRDAVVIAKEDTLEEKQLCAFVVLEKDLTIAELREYLAGKLPDYMIPVHFIILDRLPLTPNKKTDRKALIQLAAEMNLEVQFVPPTNQIEEHLVNIWEEILGREKIGINDNFFAIGGHSLEATQLRFKILRDLEIDIPLKEIFKTPTIKELGTYLQNAERSIYSAISIVEAQEYYPVSSAQKRLLILDQISNNNPGYNMPGVLIIEEEIDWKRIEQVFKTLIQRHDSLRTSFEFIDGEPVQKIVSDLEFSLVYHEINNPVLTDEEIIKQQVSEFIRPFDLSRAPLFRASLVKLASERYLLMYDMHHIISDGASKRILISEFMNLYGDRELPSLRIQYKDFAAWQNQLLESPEFHQQEQVWLEVFSGEVPVLNLPTDFSRPTMLSYRGEGIEFNIDRELTARLNKLAQKQDVTMYMLLLALYNVLLFKYTGQEDIVIGSPIAGRSHADLQNIIGLFVNTLAMRNYPTSGKSFEQFLSEVKEMALTAYDNQDYQFETLVDQLNLQRDLSRNPLFDVMFILQDHGNLQEEMGDSPIKPYPFENKVSKFDLTLNAIETFRGINCVLEYSTDLFTKETMTGFVNHLLVLIEQIIERPESKLADLEILTELEKEELISGLNATEREYPQHKSVQQLFEEQVQRTPDSTALTFAEESLTYTQLNARANRLAHYLRGRGVGRDTIVGLWTERSPELIVGQLGVLKAGGAYLPLDFEYPLERIKYMLTDSEASILVTNSQSLKGLEFTGQVIDFADGEIYREDSDNPERINQSDDLAYVIYTSGSTGKPKGVMIGHRAVHNLIIGVTERIDFTAGKRFFSVTSFSFDIFVLETLLTLSRGLWVVLATPEEQLDPEQLNNALLKHSIQLVQMTPSRMKLLLSSGKDSGLSDLQVILIGGEPFPEDLLKELRRVTSARIYNMYGPTETTVWSTIKELTTAEEVTIGEPIANTGTYVLDSGLHLVPRKVIGELYITGDGLARGYYRQPELTADRFIPDPFVPGSKMYRTGDLVRRTTTNDLQFIGRIDHQVKIRGYRIETGEIEALLLEHPQISQSVVIDAVDESGDKYLLAYLVSTGEEEVGELRQYLKNVLPEYMVPSRFVFIEEMPLTANGKIDRRGLVEPEESVLGEKEYLPPEDEIEEKLLEIWKANLGREQIGVLDNFFELGGHSLKATYMIAQVYKHLKVNLPLREVFYKPTIRELAGYIKASRQDGSFGEYVDIPLVEAQEYYPVSSAQKRLLILDQISENNTGYNMPGVLIIEEEIDWKRVEQAFKTLIQRHDSLRTSFDFINGQPVQKIEDSLEFSMDYAEIDILDGTDEEIIKQQVSEFIRPFDLSRAPLFRASLVKLASERYLLMYDMHHIISDGASKRILISEFMNLYGDRELPSLRIQYKDFAAWQNQLLESPEFHQQEQVWLEVFSGEVPVLNLPTDFSRPTMLSYRGEGIEFNIDRELTARLNKLAQKQDVTMYMLLLALYNVLLFKYTGQEDIVIGSPIAGRSHADLQNIIGLFVNTLAMRNYPTSGKSFEQFLSEVKEMALTAYDNQDYQFETLVDQLNLQRDLSRNPLFDVMFILQDHGNLQEEMGDSPIKPYPFENKVSKFDLTLNAIETFRGINCVLEYSTDLFTKETMTGFVNHLLVLIEQIIERPESKLADLEILTELEKEELISGLNATEREYPQHKSVQQLFEEQVQRTPDSTALTFAEESLTYTQLNARANRLAHYLRGRGVGRDTIVGLWTERSPELIVGQLGVLKAGGAYLPLDFEYPLERIKYMLTDSEASILVTNSQSLKGLEFTGQVIDFADGEIYREDSDNPERINQSDDLAYVIYTSGSTGKPKGVMIGHRAVHNLIIGVTERIDFTAGKRFFSVTSFSFDIFVLETLLTLSRGLWVVLATPEEQLDPEQLNNALLKHSIQLVQMTPSRMKLLLSSGKDSGLSDLQVILIGGEPFPEDLLKELRRVTSARIYNMYGPTETTVWSTIKELTTAEEVTIGEPIANTGTYVLDSGLHLVPRKVIGELYITGDGLARGYYRQPELTADRFIPDPFVPGSKMYRTGDLVRRTTTNDLQFIGRIDHQVKIRGYRIETGEIEALLLEHPQISQSVVIDAVDESGDKYLLAYLVSTGEEEVGELRQYLKNVLPEYMVPSRFVFIEEMPLTANGKIDRRGLVEPEESVLGEKEYLPPEDEIEEKLLEIWKANLGREQIGVLDNFFELGGHSLKATYMIAQVYKHLKVNLPLREVFYKPTIRELAGYIKASRQDGSFFEIKPCLVTGDSSNKQVYALSSAQKRLFVLNQLEEIRTAYNIPQVLRVEGNLDLFKLEKAFKELIERHESLRTSFHFENNEPVQIIHQNVQFKLTILFAEEFRRELQSRELSPEKQVRGLETGELEIGELEQLIQEFIKPFDLSRAPLFRVGVLKQGTGNILIFDMHHIISDGISMEILTRELLALYRGQQLPTLHLQYKDFAFWQNQLFASGRHKQLEEFWLRIFADEIPVLNLPTDFPCPGVRNFSGDRWGVEIDSRIVKKIYLLAREQGVTLYMILLSGLNILLARYSGQEDIIIGSPIAGRSHADLVNIIGMFVNTLAMRNFPIGAKTYQEFIQEVKENALQAFEHQDYQFETLVEKLDLERNPARNPLFDIVFTLQSREIDDSSVHELNLKQVKFANRTAKFDLTLNALEVIQSDTDNRILLAFEYSTQLFKPETIERMAGHYLNILQEVVDNYQMKLSRIEMISASEREQIMREFNATTCSYPQEKSIQQIFEEQVRRTPDNIAVVYNQQKFTYLELNQKANRLARTLRVKGVKPDEPVGIMIEHSIEMLTGVLAIIKAGGAYLPINPDYPEDRVQFMLRDSGTRLLLTRKGLGDQFTTDEFIYLEAEENYQSDQSDLENVNSPEDLIYIMYTSGSTGTPKGVMIKHLNVNRLISGSNMLIISETDRILQTGSLAFDASTFEIWGSLLNGAALYLVDKEILLSAVELEKTLKENRITKIWMTAPFFNQMLEENPDTFTDLETLFVGGDALSPKHINLLRSRCKDLRVINGYGPTESTTFTTYYEIQREFAETIPIGKPVSNTRVYIFDKFNRLQPIGVAGELCIAGDGLARGYLNRPELTAEKFVVNPLEERNRMYRSGDLVRWLADGNIEFLGRIDHQVKIRGFRIEPGEIENQLSNHGEVKEAVVVDIEDSPGSKYLCAYYVADRELGVAGLREYLAKNMPDYMIPSYFVQLEKMPLNTNGKIDRKRLPQPEGSINTGREYVAPATEVEERLVQIWRQVLGIDSISVTDNFFDLGGHSLKLISTLKLINQEFTTNYSIGMLFLNPTIRSFAESMGREIVLQGLECVVPLKAGTTDRNIFCIHPLGGAIHWYKDFADNLGEEYNIYGIQAKGMMHDAKLPESVIQMVAEYIQEIRKVQPDGPYTLLAFCAGSLLTYEMVRQLEADNIPVKKFILLDSAVFRVNRQKKNLATVLRSISNLFSSTQAEQESAAQTEDISENLTDQVAIRQKRVEENILQIMSKYQPANFIKSDIYLVKADDNPDRRITKELWSPLTLGQVYLLNTPGDHFTMMETPLVNETIIRVNRILRGEINR